MIRYQNFAGYFFAIMSVLAAIIALLHAYDPFGNPITGKAVFQCMLYLVAAGCSIHIAQCAGNGQTASLLPRGIVLLAALPGASLLFRASEEALPHVFILFFIIYIGHSLVLVFPARA